MKTGLVKGMALCAALQGLLAHSAWSLEPSAPVTPYPKMAPIEQYLMPDRNAEIALARSAAPASISMNAGVWVLGKQGYIKLESGSNGFVCLVQRSWWAGTDDSDFWNPKIRAPICFNTPAAESYLPLMLKRTALLLSGRSTTDTIATLTTALNAKELSASEAGAMCYMMSKQGYLGERVGHWHPHLMFFVPTTPSLGWGADLSGSPVIAAEDPENQLTIFLVPVGRWSDGTIAEAGEH